VTCVTPAMPDLGDASPRGHVGRCRLVGRRCPDGRRRPRRGRATLKLWGARRTRGAVRWPTSTTRAASPSSSASRTTCSTWPRTSIARSSPRTSSPMPRAHAEPCIECNRHINSTPSWRARRLGFDVLATGHHARVQPVSEEGPPPLRGPIPTRTSPTCSPCSPAGLGGVPPGRRDDQGDGAHACGRARLRTADKPDSQDVCFILGDAGRAGFLSERMDLHPDASSTPPGTSGRVDAVELVTAAAPGMGTRRRQAPLRLSVDVRSATVVVARPTRYSSTRCASPRVGCMVTSLGDGEPVIAQVSAHGRPLPHLRSAAGARASTSPSRSARSPRARRSRSTNLPTPSRCSLRHRGLAMAAGTPRRASPSCAAPSSTQRALFLARLARDRRRRVRRFGRRAAPARSRHPELVTADSPTQRVGAPRRGSSRRCATACR